MGVPSDLDAVATSEPYYRSSYVFLSRKSSGLSLGTLSAPQLRNVRVGVHLVGDDYANSPPAHALSDRGIVDNVVGYSVFGDYGSDSPPRTLVDAVGQGEIDVAIVWGPIGGYFARSQPVPMRLEALVAEDQDRNRRFTFDMAVGFRRDDPLGERINQILARQKKQVRAILTDYGVPLFEP